MATSPRKRAAAAAPAPVAQAETPHRRATDVAPQAETIGAADVGSMPVGIVPTPPVPVAFDNIGNALYSVDLSAIVALTIAGGFAYTSPATHSELIASGDVEINPGVVHPSGMIGTRATTQGIEKVTNQAQTQAPAVDPAAAAPAAAPAAAAPKVSFEIETGVELPTIKRNVLGHGNTKYPFDKLEIGQSFFVPGGSVKALASTVASANERYSEEVDGQTRVNRKGKTVPVTKSLRRFVVRNDEKNGVKGARIGRIAVVVPGVASE